MNQKKQNEQIFLLIEKLTLSSEERLTALISLSGIREKIPDLAVYLWNSPTTMTVFLSEIISIYPFLANNSISSNISSRICHVLALLQCVAGHDLTRIPFIRANIPIYLFPFLHQTNTSKEIEFIKVTSLGIIGSLVKTEQPQIIEYLLKVDIIPLCLRILKFSTEISRTVAAFIIHQILIDKVGKEYISSSKEKLNTILRVMIKVIVFLIQEYSLRLGKHIISSVEILMSLSEFDKLEAIKNLNEIFILNIPSNLDQSFLNFLKKLKEKLNNVYFYFFFYYYFNQ